MIAGLSLVNLESNDEVSGFSPPDRFVRHVEVPWSHRGIAPRGAGMRSEYSGVGREVILVEAVFHGGAEATSAAALLRALDPLRSMTAPGRHGYPPPCLLIHADESQTVVFDHLAIELRVNEGIALVAMRLSVLSDREKLDRVVAGVPRLNDAGSAPRVTPPVAGPGVNGLAAGDATDVLTHAQAVLDRPGGDVGDLDQWLARLDRRPVSEAADALHAAAIQHGPIADSTQTVLSDWKEKLDSRTEHWVQAFSKKLPAGLTETVRQQLSVSLQQGMYDALKRAFESIKEEILAAERHPILEEAKSAADGIKRAYESSVKSATEAWSAEANDASQEGAGSQPVGKPPSDPAKARMEQAREISAQRVISQNREEEMRRQIRAIAVQVEKAASVLGSAAVGVAVAKRSIDDRIKHWSERHRSFESDPLVQGVIQEASKWEDDVKRKLDAQLNTERGRLTQCFPKGAVAVRSEIDVIVTKRLPTFVVELGKTTSTRLNNVRDQLKKEAAVVSQDLEKSQVDLTNASDALAAAWKQLEV